jgi:leucyl/phenylalanyl-tRNA--protein transferase
VPVFRLDEKLAFPPPHLAEQGLVAVGGDLRPERLLLAYSLGIFPWYEEGQPILWHSPDPRMVLRADALHVPRSLAKVLARGTYAFTLDQAFPRVIEACARQRRPRQRTTWITKEMRSAYVELHRRGYAHSVEAWTGDSLVGGLYGVSLGGAFFGESMFARSPDASKGAFVWLCRQLARWGILLIDCQVYTDHLARFGAEEEPREAFLSALRPALGAPTRLGPWRFDDDLRVLTKGDASPKPRRAPKTPGC